MDMRDIPVSRRKVLAGLGGASALSFLPHPAVAGEERVTYFLGDQPVTVRTISSGHGFTYVNLHENESTSLRAGIAAVREHGGRLVYLIHGGGRNINFMFRDTQFTLDPNRIFTDLGIELTLRDQSGNYSVAVHAHVQEFAARLLDHLALGGLRGGTLVSLHNNTDNNYSLRSYQSGGPYEQDAAAVHAAAGSDPDNFFFVTKERTFNDLAALEQSVVLQNNANVRDDGSLSVLCARRGVTYVNVEAEHGQTQAQREMLEVLNTF